MVVAAAPHVEAAMSCGSVAKNLSPCLGYVRGQGSIPPACCTGIKALNGDAKSTPDRQTVCQCLKSAAGTISGVQYNLVSGLPRKCGGKVRLMKDETQPQDAIV
ncbi:Bifunctional inhibitor/plant lipid transfer protein/seed storage helical domain [Dillenia turbinata]|uniref:Non-specific lipid-transfer protein n=1 Tax=Dillenia turbinata TaxID=194707 RepID=A0AAN8UYZ6_9MAGN